MNSRRRFLYAEVAALLLLLNACDSGNRPLDADTRAAIDSISSIEIGKARKELDSLCVVEEKTQMAQWVDSIKKHRLKEIEQKLKNVPR